MNIKQLLQTSVNKIRAINTSLDDINEPIITPNHIIYQFRIRREALDKCYYSTELEKLRELYKPNPTYLNEFANKQQIVELIKTLDTIYQEKNESLATAARKKLNQLVTNQVHKYCQKIADITVNFDDCLDVMTVVDKYDRLLNTLQDTIAHNHKKTVEFFDEADSISDISEYVEYQAAIENKLAQIKQELAKKQSLAHEMIMMINTVMTSQTRNPFDGLNSPGEISSTYTRHINDFLYKKNALFEPRILAACDILQWSGKTEESAQIQSRFKQDCDSYLQTIRISAENTKQQIADELAYNLIYHSRYSYKMLSLLDKFSFMRLHVDVYCDAIPVVEALLGRLEMAEQTFLNSRAPIEQRLVDFKISCMQAMDAKVHEPLNELTKHRGWNQFFANFIGIVVSVISLGILAPAAYQLKLFDRKPDTAAKVDELKAEIVSLCVN